MIMVPVEISHFALSESKEYQIYCYLLLKQQTAGMTYLNKRQISVLSAELGRSDRTVRRYLSYLENIGWIAPQGKVHIIKSWKKVFDLMDFKYVAGVEYDVTKIDDPQAFFAGIVLGRLANFQRYKQSKGKGKSTIYRQCASTQPRSANFFPIADRALASILNISKTKAHKLKKNAFKAKYIDLKYDYRRFKLDGKPVTIEKHDEALFRRVFAEIGQKMRLNRSGRVSIQEADLIRPNLHYKRSKNYR